MSTELPEDTNLLTRVLTFKDLLFYGLAYLAPVAPLTTLGLIWDMSGGQIVASYFLAAICIYFTANSYAVMVKVVPSAGSVYGYAAAALGPLSGHIAGWMILLDYLLSPALVYVLMAVGLSSLIPVIDRTAWIVMVAGIAFTINWYGVKITTKFSFFAVFVQTAIVMSVVGICLSALYGGAGHGSLTLQPLMDPDRFSLAALSAGVSICILSYLGFDAISTLSEEVEKDQRDSVAKAIFSVLFIAAAFFSFVAWVLSDLIAAHKFTDNAAAIYELLDRHAPSWVSVALVWPMILIGGFSNLLPIQVGVARILYAMGRDGRLPRILGSVHPKTKSPCIAMASSSIVSVAIALSFNQEVEVLASLVSFGAISGFVLLHLSVLGYFNSSKNRSFLHHRLMPVIGFASLFLVLQSMHNLAILVGLAWLFSGLVVYFFSPKHRY